MRFSRSLGWYSATGRVAVGSVPGGCGLLLRQSIQSPFRDQEESSVLKLSLSITPSRNHCLRPDREHLPGTNVLIGESPSVLVGRNEAHKASKLGCPCGVRGWMEPGREQTCKW